MILWNSTHQYNFKLDGTSIDIKEHLKIFKLCLDNKLSFKEDRNEVLKWAYATIAALCSLLKLLSARKQFAFSI